MAPPEPSDLQLVAMPAEIFNSIIEYAVINRDALTGKKRPIRWQSYAIVTRRHLRANRACKTLYHAMTSIYYGQNIFHFVQQTITFIGSGRPSLEDHAIGTGLRVFRGSTTGATHEFQIHEFAMLLPAHHLNLLKNIILDIEIPSWLVRKVENKEALVGLGNKGVYWLCVVKSLAAYGIHLEKLIVKLSVSKRASRPVEGWQRVNLRAKYGLIKSAVEDFLEDAGLSGTEVKIEYPSELTPA